MEVAGLGDKRQITAVFGFTLAGDFLPVQLMYQGKTNACHPQVNFPEGWSITHTPNHWSNESMMKEYIENILVPYLAAKKEELGLQPTNSALALFDVFRGQCTEQSWMIRFYDYIRAKPTIIKNGFSSAGISEALGIMDQ